LVAKNLSLDNIFLRVDTLKYVNINLVVQNLDGVGIFNNVSKFHVK